MSTYLQLDCLYLKKQIYSETFCYPTPHVKLVNFDKSPVFSHLVLLFLQKHFLCVKLQYLVSTYLQLDSLYLKKQIYSETFCYPTPHVKLVNFDKSPVFSHLVLLFLQQRFLCVKLQYLVSTYLQLDSLYLKKQIYSETFCYPTLPTFYVFN